MEEERLTIARTGLQSVDLRIDVAVGYKKIQPGIVIHIKEGRTPANIRIAGPAHSRGPTYIVEPFCAQVAIEGIGLFFKMGHKKTQASAMVVVAEIHSHVSKFQALAAQRDPGQQAGLGEGAIVIVVIKIVGNGIVGDQKIGPAIVVVIGPNHA